MKIRLSILGGSIARSLLSQLEFEPRFTTLYERNELIFSLRNSQTKSGYTGGLVLRAYQTTKNPCGGFGKKWEYRTRPHQRDNAARLLNNRISLIIREWYNERLRQEAVARMDATAAPYVKDVNFLSWVEAQERSVGESDYQKLSTEQANAWTEAIRDWQNSPQTAFVATIHQA